MNDGRKHYKFKGYFANGKSVEVYATTLDNATIMILHNAIGYWSAKLDLVINHDTGEQFKPTVTISHEKV